MLERIYELVDSGQSFAFETTLATKSYRNLIKAACKAGYQIILLFMTLDSVDLAFERVRTRVIEGGHDIPVEIIERRFRNGLSNLFKIYLQLVDQWILVDNSSEIFEFIAEGSKSDIIIRSEAKWNYLNKKYNGDQGTTS